MGYGTIPYLNRDLDWNFTPNGDEEWVFMLNRHEYFEKLIAAYYFSNDEKYLDKLKELIFNWIENNEIKECGGQTIRTIDTGIRCFSWMKSLLHLIHENKLEDEEIEMLRKLINYPRDFISISTDYYFKQKMWDEEVFLSRLKNKLEIDKFRMDILNS